MIRRGRLFFEHLVVAIGVNLNKTSLFDVEERVEMARQVVRPFPNVSVEAFEGLTVHFVRRIGARVILRGLRTLSDMEYEFGMTLTNHRLDPEVETVFLMADGEYSHVSSTLIKQVAYYGGTEALRRFVPEELIRADPGQAVAAIHRQPRGMNRSRDHCRRPSPRATKSSCSVLTDFPGAVEVGIGQPAGEAVFVGARPGRDRRAS